MDFVAKLKIYQFVLFYLNDKLVPSLLKSSIADFWYPGSMPTLKRASDSGDWAITSFDSRLQIRTSQQKDVNRLMVSSVAFESGMGKGGVAKFLPLHDWGDLHVIIVIVPKKLVKM